MRRTTRAGGLASVALAAALLLAACAPAAEPTPEPSDGPGGSGPVAAEPEGLTPETVTDDTACELASTSATLTQLGLVGTPVSSQFTVDLSYCDLRFEAAEFADSGLSVSVLRGTEIADIAMSDPTVSGSTLVLLPDVGTDGYFAGFGPAVDPATNPTNGAIGAARDDLGIVVAWSTGPTIPFATFEQAVRELLDALG